MPVTFVAVELRVDFGQVIPNPDEMRIAGRADRREDLAISELGRTHQGGGARRRDIVGEVPLADALARSIAPPTEIPLGVLLAFVGVPTFLYLYLRPAGATRLWGM